MRGDVTDARRQTNNKQLKIELLSQWKLEAESRNIEFVSRAEFTWWHFYSWRHDQVGKPLEFVLLFGSFGS